MHGRFSIIGGTCPGCPLSLYAHMLDFEKKTLGSTRK